MTIIAHKGFSLKYSENSIKAFNEAIIANSDGIELDINIDNNNKYIIWHDKVSTQFIDKNNVNKHEDEQIIYFDDFVEYINSTKFKILVENNILVRNNKFKIILDIKLSRNKLNNFMVEYFPKYYDSINKIDNIITIIQSGIINGFSDYDIKDKNKLKISFLYNSYQKLYTLFLGINMSLLKGADEIMYDYTCLNFFNIFMIWFQLKIYKIIGSPYKINFFTINNKYIAFLLQLIFSCSIITDDPNLLK